MADDDDVLSAALNLNNSSLHSTRNRVIILGGLVGREGGRKGDFILFIVRWLVVEDKYDEDSLLLMRRKKKHTPIDNNNKYQFE